MRQGGGNGAWWALGAVGAVAAAGALRRGRGSPSREPSVYAYYDDDGDLGEGRYIAGVVDGEIVGQIEVFGSTRSLTNFVRDEHNTVFKGLGRGPGGYLGGIELSQEARGRGIGRSVVEAMLSVAKKQGLNYVVLLSEREPYGFWSRLGFKDADTEDDGWLYLDAMVMRLEKRA